MFKPYLYSRGKYLSHNIVLIKPLTYMNHSGIILPAVLKKFKMDIHNLLVLCDNLDLEAGRCKFKLKGSPATHNGLKSISSYIKSNEYMRLFIGIDHPGNREDVIGHVLGDPDSKEIALYDKSYKNAVAAVLNISEDLHEQVMNELNRKKTGR